MNEARHLAACRSLGVNPPPHGCERSVLIVFCLSRGEQRCGQVLLFNTSTAKTNRRHYGGAGGWVKLERIVEFNASFIKSKERAREKDIEHARWMNTNLPKERASAEPDAIDVISGVEFTRRRKTKERRDYNSSKHDTDRSAEADKQSKSMK